MFVCKCYAFLRLSLIAVVLPFAPFHCDAEAQCRSVHEPCDDLDARIASLEKKVSGLMVELQEALRELGDFREVKKKLGNASATKDDSKIDLPDKAQLEYERLPERLFQSNYKYNVTYDNLPKLALFCEKAKNLSTISRSIAFLVQDADDHGLKNSKIYKTISLGHVSSALMSEIISLTWRQKTAGSIFFPQSTLNDGRNALFYESCRQEVLRGSKFEYFVFFEDDAEIRDGSIHDWLGEMFAFEPAVFVPVYLGPGGENYQPHASRHPEAICQWDHIFMGLHRDAADKLLPYKTEFDTECWWVSQWRLNCEACFYHRGHTLISQKLVIDNGRDAAESSSADYKREMCFEHMDLADDLFRFTVPRSKRCWVAHYREVNYSPWGVAEYRKGTAYEYPSHEHVPPCPKKQNVTARGTALEYSWSNGHPKARRTSVPVRNHDPPYQ